MIAFFVLSIVLISIFSILLLPSLWSFLYKLSMTYIGIILTVIFNILMLYVAKIYTTSKNLIKRRRLLTFVEFFYFFTGIASTIVKGVIRFVLAIFSNFFNIFRVDRPVISGKIYPLDEAYNVYAGLLMMNHINNNPIVITFIDLLSANTEIE